MSDVDNKFIYGPTTKSLHEVFLRHKDKRGLMAQTRIRHALNHLNLFPTHSQVNEYVHCACEANTRTHTNHITFPEFALFNTELQHYYDNHTTTQHPRSQQKGKFVKALQIHRRQRRFSGNISGFQVFLGGSCNPTTWRKDLAIPFFKKHAITYYNPQVGNWRPDLMELEDQAKQTADLLFFVIDNQTRSTASMVEAAYIAGCGRQLILVIRKFMAPVFIYDEKICHGELEDLERSHAYLTDLVERMNIPVFNHIHHALNATNKALRHGVLVSDLGLEDGCQPVKHPDARVAGELLNIKEVFNTVDSNNTGFLTHSDVCLAYRTITRKSLKAAMSSQGTTNKKQQYYTIQQFLSLLAEFKYQRRSWLHSFFLFIFHFPFSLFDWWRWWTDRGLEGGEVRGRDLFLGGSCGKSSWRDHVAIPILRRHGVSYYNPQLEGWQTHCIPREAAIKQQCKVLLYVITEDTRAMTSMLEAGYFIGQGCEVVLCIKYVPEDATIHGNKLTTNAVNDYNRSRSYLADLANRDGIAVFDDITQAVMQAVDKAKS